MGTKKWLGLASVLTAVALCGCQGSSTSRNVTFGDRPPPAANNANNWNKPSPNMASGQSGFSTAGGVPTPIGATNGIAPANYRTPTTGMPATGGLAPAGGMMPTTGTSGFGGPSPNFPVDPNGFNPGSTTTRFTTPNLPANPSPPPYPGAPAQPTGPNYPTNSGIQSLPASPAPPPFPGNQPANFGGPSAPPYPR